ncbi:hypothetical protein [Bergeyella sp. RCAD1439]|uniref:hypothetical protein n=1 Tax=Bergeyella anatis TaxID=3113737 RepID=UPI002E19F14F|nr:hypothetical protein [Bergeyella sp. RCAD1439]
MSFNYRNQEGILLNTESQRYNFRINSDHQVNPWLKVGENLSYSMLNGNGANTNDGYIGAILSAMYYVPSLTVYEESGNYSGLPLAFAGDYGDMINPVAYLNRIDFRNPSHSLMVNPYLEVKLGAYLKYRSNLAITQRFTGSKDVKRRRLEIGKLDRQNQVAYTNDFSKTLLAEQVLSYDRTFNGHHLDLTGVYSFQKDSSEGFAAMIQNFPQEISSFMYLQNGLDNKTMSSYLERRALNSMMFRVNYDYRSKYMVSLIGRRDGTSLLPEKNRYESFYAVSGAWNVAKENFMAASGFSTFKLRASHGYTGNL